MKSIKAVVFDIGRVILPLNWDLVTHGLGLDSVGAQELADKIVNGEHYDRYERGLIETDDFFARFGLEYGIDHPPEHLLKAWNAMILEPYEGIESLLSRLKNRVEIYTLSNTSRAHHDHFREFYDLFDHFHGIHTSFTLGFRKPEVEIYHSLLQAIGHSPECTLFIDDLDENLEVARALGMNAEKSVDSVETTEEILKKYGLL